MCKKLDDGNKESTKEALAALRFIGGWSMSLSLVLAGLWARGIILMCNTALLGTLIFFTMSFTSVCLASMYAVTFLYNANEKIIFQGRVLYPSQIAFVAFVFGLLTLLLGVAFTAPMQTNVAPLMKYQPAGTFYHPHPPAVALRLVEGDGGEMPLRTGADFGNLEKRHGNTVGRWKAASL